ncbi:MAG TPA: CAP domain-containing protein [Blastocatellia bacterium]|nr:CAP domain-containing protein [Blastocatellia bacterium]
MYRVLCLILFLAFVLLASDVLMFPTEAVVNVPSTTTSASTTIASNIEEQVLAAINRVREDNHLAPLSVAKDLTSVARLHSQDMATRDYFSHVTPEGDTMRKRVLRFGITNWNLLAENIAMNYGHLDPAGVAVKGWLNSQGHRHNILDHDLTETGIGVAIDAKGRIFLTQLFARRK